MKHILLISLSLLFVFSGLTAKDARLTFHLAQMLEHERNQSKQISVLVKGDPQQVQRLVEAYGGKFKYSAGHICSLLIPVSTLRRLAEDPSVERIEEGSVKLRTMNDRMLINNKIDLVHNGTPPLTQGYDGQGVVMGIIDTGIDFTHPDFQDSTGKTRILWIWDHILPVAANTPALYGYGQEFSKINIDSGQASAHVDQTAHGTHVAGIAAGNGRSGAIFTGACPKADIIAVSLDFNQADDVWLSSVADAVNYIFAKADSLNEPCVINISAGTYFGTHDGTDLASQALDNMITAQPGHVVVCAAGNAGNYPIHLRQNPVADTAFTWFSTSASSIYFECIGDSAQMSGLNFAVGMDRPVTPVENRGFSHWNNAVSTLGILTVDSIMNSLGNRVALIEKYATLVNGTYNLMMNIIPDSAGYWFSLNSAGTGLFDLWSFDMVTSGLPSVADYPYIVHYTMPDVNQSICSSFQCSDKVITVGQYVNRNNYVDVNGNLQTFPLTEGALAASSSKGPTRDGRVKPDITSTGELTLSCLKLSSQAWFLANQPFKLAQGGMHIRDGGTSSASPAVAGIAALYLQKNPTATAAIVKDHILNCSVQDAFTGSALPDNNWGHGKADAFAAITGCAIAGISQANTVSLNTYPNPAITQVNLNIKHTGKGLLTLYNSNGKLISQFRVNTQTGAITISRNNLPAGLYYLQFVSDCESSNTKFIFQ